MYDADPAAGGSLVEALPFNVPNPPTALLVETDVGGAPTGRLYLAGASAQVAILQDAAPQGLASQSSALWASVLAQRAVALTVAPGRFHDGRTLPPLPGFLVAPGAAASTRCFGAAQPFAAGSVTATTAITPTSGGTNLVDLRLSVSAGQGSETSARHWVVSVTASGYATITVDAGTLDPFNPQPPQPCPV